MCRERPLPTDDILSSPELAPIPWPVRGKISLRRPTSNNRVLPGKPLMICRKLKAVGTPCTHRHSAERSPPVSFPKRRAYAPTRQSHPHRRFPVSSRSCHPLSRPPYPAAGCDNTRRLVGNFHLFANTARCGKFAFFSLYFVTVAL